MAVAALVTWVIAALGGFYLLAAWLRGGGMRQQRGGATRFPAGLLFGHLGLAAVGLVLWLVYVVGGSSGIGVTALVVVLLVAVLGFTLFSRWLSGRVGPRATSAPAGEVAAEQTFPQAAVVAHGLVAAVTIVLVLVAVFTA